jgi:hypothetical protein
MEKQVEIAERFPFLQRQEWSREATLRAEAFAGQVREHNHRRLCVRESIKVIPCDFETSRGTRRCSRISTSHVRRAGLKKVGRPISRSGKFDLNLSSHGVPSNLKEKERTPKNL